MLPPEGASGAATTQAQPAAAATTSGDGGASAQQGQQGQPAASTTPARNWEKDYSDLEGRYKSYERFGTPEQIDNAIKWAHWAQGIKQRLDAGEYVSRAELDKLQRGQQGQGQQQDPYAEGVWETLTPQQQAAAHRAEIMKSVSESLDAFKKELGGMQQMSQGQLNLAMKLIPLLAKNPDLNPTELLGKMFERVTISPERAAELEVESMLAPKLREREIADAVEKATKETEARLRQEFENAQQAQFGMRPGPRLVPSDKKTRTERAQANEAEFNKAFNKIVRSA